MDKIEILELLYRIDEGYEPSKGELRQLAKVNSLVFRGFKDNRGELSKSMHLLTNLRKLSISASTQVTSLEPLSKMKTLKEFRLLWGSSVADLSPLKNLPDLETLWLNDSPMADISSLSNLKKLRRLSLFA